jgi:hypothetical protein
VHQRRVPQLIRKRIRSPLRVGKLAEELGPSKFKGKPIMVNLMEIVSRPAGGLIERLPCPDLRTMTRPLTRLQNLDLPPDDDVPHPLVSL